MKLCLNCHKQFADEVELCPHEGSFLVPLPNDPLLGALIDERYRVESLIAKGAVGSVYKAKQELLGRQVALKVLHGYLGADPESLVRFHREAKALSRLEHPNLLTLYDFGMTADGQPYFVMDLLTGTTLAKELSSEGCLDARRAILIVQQVLEALSEAHKKGIIHRDIKAPNIILVEKEDTKDFVKLVDFSIAKMADNSTIDPVQLTVDGIICGSPAYMSPEQCRGGDVDGRSDIYSIGIVLFEALTGKRPFSAKDLVSLMYLHVNEEPPKLSDIEPGRQFPQPLEALVSSTLDKDPAKRPQNVEEMLEKLKNVLKECSDSFSAMPRAAIHLNKTADPAQAAASSLFTTEADRRQNFSSDKHDVFIGVRAKNRGEVLPESKAQTKDGNNGFRQQAEPTNFVETDSTASLIELSNADLPAFLNMNEQPKVDLQSFDATPGASSSDTLPTARMQPANAAAISQSYDPSRQDLPPANSQGDSHAPHSVSYRQQEESGSRHRENRQTGSHAQDAAANYSSESTAPSVLKMIVPLIIFFVIVGVGILKLWDLATPDTPAEMLVRGQTEQAISVLENRQRTNRHLSPEDTNTLHSAYLNSARKYANQNKYGQAIATLKKVPAGSPLQDTAGRLMQAYKRQLFMSTGR